MFWEPPLLLLPFHLSVCPSVTPVQKPRFSILATVRSYTETNEQPTCFESLHYHLVVSPVCLSIYVTWSIHAETRPGRIVARSGLFIHILNFLSRIGSCACACVFVTARAPIKNGYACAFTALKSFSTYGSDWQTVFQPFLNHENATLQVTFWLALPFISPLVR